MELQRQVYVANRVKTNYDSVLCNVDDLNLAINHNCKIQFDYYEWTLNKQMKIRENEIIQNFYVLIYNNMYRFPYSPEYQIHILSGH